MRATGIVEVEIQTDGCSGLAYRVVGLEIDLLVLHALPQPFHKHVVAPAALAIHADLDAVVVERVNEGGSGELAALISCS